MNIFFIFLAVILAFCVGIVIGHNAVIEKINAKIKELDYEDIAIIRRVFLHYNIPIQISVAADKFREAFHKQ